MRRKNGAAKRRIDHWQCPLQPDPSTSIIYENGRAKAPAGMEWREVMTALMEDGRHIEATLQCLHEMRGIDPLQVNLNGVIQCWVYAQSGCELVAKGHPSASVRERFKRIMEERRDSMNAILARAGAKSRFA